MNGLTIIKLGGSLLTDKTMPYTLRRNKLRDIAKELRGMFSKLIIVHGVGSFGHPPVKEYGLYKGFKKGEDLINLAHTQSKVFLLRTALADALAAEGIEAMIFLPSSVIVSENGNIKKFYTEPIEHFMLLGMVPLLGGDIVHDEKMGFSVCSGDAIALYLAYKLRAKRVIFASDVNGIYTKDPKKYENAKLLKEVELNEIFKNAELSGSSGIDITSGMRGKVEKLREYAPLLDDVEIVFLSMMEYGNLQRYLKDEKNAKYTRIKIKNKGV